MVGWLDLEQGESRKTGLGVREIDCARDWKREGEVGNVVGECELREVLVK